MKYYISILLVISFFTGTAASHSIVLVHLGEKLPTYISDTLFQARLFNPTCEIVLLANQEALNKYDENQNLHITKIAVEQLTKTEAHKQFYIQSTLMQRLLRSHCINQHWTYKSTYRSAYNKKSRINKHKRVPIKLDKNFWFYACERFFYLEDYMQQYNQQHVFHIETDVMLYADLATLLPTFKTHYSGIAAVFDNDDRCIPSIVYASKSTSLNPLSKCFLQYAAQGKWDMEVLAILRKNAPTTIIDSLPIIMNNYQKKHPLKSSMGHTPVDPKLYSKNISLFNSVFDGAALGQYLGGIIYDPNQIGFINERCLFNPSHLKFQWRIDELGRKMPYMIFEGKSFRINNLHIHSKKTERFLSIPRKSSSTDLEEHNNEYQNDVDYRSAILYG